MGHYLELPKLVHPDFSVPNRKPVGPVEVDHKTRLGKLGLYWAFQTPEDLFDRVRRYRIPEEGITVAVNPEYRQSGLVIRPSARLYRIEPDIDNYLSSQQRGTCAVEFYRGNTTSTGAIVIFYNNFTSSNQWKITWQNTNQLVGLLVVGGVTQFALAHTFSSTAINDHIKVVLTGGEQGAKFWVWRNGVLEASLTDASTSWMSNLIGPDEFALAGQNTGAPVNTHVYLSEVLYTEHQWGDAQAEYFFTTPYAALKPLHPITYFIPAAGGGGASINAILSNIALSTNQATTSLSKDVLAQLESILLTEQQSTVSLGKSVSAGVESISLSTLQANIQADVDVSINGVLESIQISAFAASLSVGAAISAALESITVTENTASLALDRDISANQETISVTANAAQLTLGANIAASLEQISVTSNQAGIVLDVAINASQESITISQLAAIIGLSSAVDAVKENITLTANGATLVFDSGINASLEQIALSTFDFTLVSSVQTPTQPGLEYTIPLSKMGYTIPISKIHFTFREED